MFYAVYKLSSQLLLLNIRPTKWLFKNISPWIYFLGFILKYNLCCKSAQYSECVLLNWLVKYINQFTNVLSVYQCLIYVGQTDQRHRHWLEFPQLNNLGVAVLTRTVQLTYTKNCFPFFFFFFKEIKFHRDWP